MIGPGHDHDEIGLPTSEGRPELMHPAQVPNFIPTGACVDCSRPQKKKEEGRFPFLFEMTERQLNLPGSVVFSWPLDQVISCEGWRPPQAFQLPGSKGWQALEL